MCIIKRTTEEKTLGKLSVVMLRCVFWNAPTVYYNTIIMLGVRREKKLSIGTRAKDSNDVRQQPPRRTRRAREIVKKKLKR